MSLSSKTTEGKIYVNSKGFTLIELLVVISIIGLLSSVVLSSVTAARKKAIDAAIIQDARQLKTAFELYYAANKRYPNTSTTWYSTWPSGAGPTTFDPSGLFTAAMGPYFKPLPTARYIAPDSFIGYFETEFGYNGVYGCGNQIVSGPNVKKYIIAFTTTNTSNFPIVWDNDDGVWYDGTGGYPRWYCLSD